MLKKFFFIMLIFNFETYSMNQAGADQNLNEDNSENITLVSINDDQSRQPIRQLIKEDKKKNEKTPLMKASSKDEGCSSARWVACVAIGGISLVAAAVGVTYLLTDSDDTSVISSLISQVNSLQAQVETLQSQVAYWKFEATYNCSYSNFVNCLNGTDAVFRYCRKALCGDDQMDYNCSSN